MALKLRYFKLSEFACKCGRKECDATPMKDEFLLALDELRDMWGMPMVVTSGQRCKWHNKKEGGALRSQHLYGNAADISVPKSKQKEFVKLARLAGFNGIGWGSTFVHVDMRKVPAEWTY